MGFHCKLVKTITSLLLLSFLTACGAELARPFTIELNESKKIQDTEVKITLTNVVMEPCKGDGVACLSRATVELFDGDTQVTDILELTYRYQWIPGESSFITGISNELLFGNETGTNTITNLDDTLVNFTPSSNWTSIESVRRFNFYGSALTERYQLILMMVSTQNEADFEVKIAVTERASLAYERWLDADVSNYLVTINSKYDGCAITTIINEMYQGDTPCPNKESYASGFKYGMTTFLEEHVWLENNASDSLFGDLDSGDQFGLLKYDQDTGHVIEYHYPRVLSADGTVGPRTHSVEVLPLKK